jgi:Na+/melibiose symporter-like transporter
MLISFKLIEPAIRWFGLKNAINLGFLILTLANLALWLSVLQIDNSSDFATLVFVSRFISGIGSGMIDSACLISRTTHKRE